MHRPRHWPRHPIETPYADPDALGKQPDTGTASLIDGGLSACRTLRAEPSYVALPGAARHQGHGVTRPRRAMGPVSNRQSRLALPRDRAAGGEEPVGRL